MTSGWSSDALPAISSPGKVKTMLMRKASPLLHLALFLSIKKVSTYSGTCQSDNSAIDLVIGPANSTCLRQPRIDWY